VARLDWTDDALADLDGIASAIDGTSPMYAAAFVQRVLDATALLADFPLLGRMVPEFSNGNLRELILQNYRIVYRVMGERVELLTILHGAVDIRSRSRAW
jgi:plasmid stabilization system protein ParE